MRVASAAAVRPRDRSQMQQAQQSPLPWQEEALLLCRVVPECKFSANFYARMMSKVQIFAARGESFEDAEKIESGAPVDALKRIQDPGGGHSQLLYRYGKLMWITGEGYLFGQDVDGSRRGRWSFVWRDELKVNTSNKVTHVLKPGLTPETLTLKDDNYREVPAGSCVAYRMWTPDPQYSGLPDAPMGAVIQVGKELLLLSDSVMATATSRIAKAQVLLMPQELSPPPAEPIGDEDPLNDPFVSDLVQHFGARIENPSSPEALVPPIVWGQSEYLGDARVLKLHDSEHDYLEKDLRSEAITRLGYGLDLPPEVVTGMTRANHWSASIVSDAMWSDHGDPKIRQFCADLTDAYLRPALEAARYPNPDDVIVSYDASQVTINPDRSDDANEAWDRGAIGYRQYRKMKAIPEDSGQTPEEHAEWYSIKVPQRYTQPDSAQAPNTDVQTPARKEADTRTGDPAKLASGAAALALQRCRELAGVRLRREQKFHPDLFRNVDGAPDASVANLLGQDALDALLANPRNDLDLLGLVADGTEGFRSLLLEWGYERPQVDAACSMIELHAARTLLQPGLPDIPAGLTAQLARL